MTNKVLLAVASMLEAATGLVLIIAPSMVVRLLLNAEISGAAVVIARMAGFGLLSFGGCLLAAR
jgi:hypothetical protein